VSLVNSRTLSTRPRPRPRTIEIVLEDPRGQGHVLEDSITAYYSFKSGSQIETRDATKTTTTDDDRQSK